MQEYSTLAAIDMGSNSFHLQVGRVEGEQLFYLDSIKDSVRLAGGLTADKQLDEPAQQRALACLARFGERLQGMPAGAVRVVGTSALRVAKNAPQFLEQARQVLGFDIEIVAGREEARLIYLGVSHSLPMDEAPRLVVDIGGGSTECIIGQGHEPRERESLRMGCVVFSNRYFPGGELDKAGWKAAETAARMEVRAVAGQFHRAKWTNAVGSSGTAKALAGVIQQNGLSDGQITLDGLKWLRERVIKAGKVDKLDIDGLKADRRPIIAGGAAIMLALFQAFDIEQMTAAQGAMREGILWDLLGRVHDHDMRDLTVTQFMRRYHVVGRQARRVERLATRLCGSFKQCAALDNQHYLTWAAKLHEVGISIAHSGFHKHGAYILENADMPGFSRRDQSRLATLVRASRGGLGKLDLAADDPIWARILCLRLAILFHQARSPVELPVMRLECGDGQCVLALSASWLSANPLTQSALQDELANWQDVKASVRLAAVRAL